MTQWLGIGHLFELSRTEAILGFFTPLAVFAAFFLALLVLPGRWVPGYVIDPQTGEPRKYRLNGILVFLVDDLAANLGGNRFGTGFRPR